MLRAFGQALPRRSTPGGSATGCARNCPSGPTATCMTSACRGAISSAKPKSRSGGLEWQPTPAPPPDEGRRPISLRREPAMSTLRFDNLQQYSDVLRSRQGEKITVRFVEPRDGEELQNYYRSLSARSRYNRFLGAMNELPPQVLDSFTHVGMVEGFTVVATMMVDGFETIVGEARYALHPKDASLEFGLSIEDRWQGHGIGSAL